MVKLMYLLFQCIDTLWNGKIYQNITWNKVLLFDFNVLFRFRNMSQFQGVWVYIRIEEIFEHF